MLSLPRCLAGFAVVFGAALVVWHILSCALCVCASVCVRVSASVSVLYLAKYVI